MSHLLHVLIVEDSEDDALLVLRHLQRSGFTLVFERVETAESMNAALSQRSWDIVIADYVLPNFSALDALKLLQQRAIDLPFIIVSGSIGENIAVDAMKAGAHDYLMKNHLVRLVPAVERELREAEERRKRRRAERAIYENEERFRSLIENALDIITVISPDGTLYYVSPSIERVLGYLPDTCLGRNVFRYIHPDHIQLLKDTFADLMQNSTASRTIEFQFRHCDGSWRVLEAIGKQFAEADGTIRIVVNSRDITERKQTEEIRKALQREKELHDLKSKFISMASHEFRTPLSVITMCTGLLKQFGDVASEEKKQQYLGRIQDAVTRMTHLLDDVLFLGKSEADKLKFTPAPLELCQFCHDLVEEAQMIANTHRIVFTCDHSPLWGNVDEFLLRHILTNLLSNAIKYSLDTTMVQLQVTSEDGWAVFRIADHGIGIPVTDQPHLFESFHRGENVGKTPGTGLGLSIVKRSIELHSGKIVVESTVGVGTTVDVRLPLTIAN